MYKHYTCTLTFDPWLLFRRCVCKRSLSGMEKLRDETTCSKCRKQLSQPKLLPCFHSVCSSCLVIRAGVRQAEGLPYMVACPQCGAEAELPKTGIFSLPTSFFKVHMAEAYQRLLEEEAGACQQCGDEGRNKVVAYCRDCDHVICSDCKQRHQHLGALSGHQLEPLKEHKQDLRHQPTDRSPPSETSSDVFPPTLLCQKHGNPLDTYCRTCSVLVCKECIKADHMEPRHKLGFVHSLVSHQKVELTQSLGVVKEMQAAVAKSISNLKSTQELVARQEEELCSSIDDSFAVLMRNLEECKKRLISSLCEANRSWHSHINQQVQTLEEKSEDLENLTQVCDQTLEHASDQEFMALRRSLTTRIKEVCVHWQQSALGSDDPNPPQVTLPFSLTHEVLNVFTCYTNNHLCLSPDKSSLSGAPLEVGKAAHLTVHTRNASGKIHPEGAELEVQVSQPRSGDVIHASVSPGADLGTYEISFLPSTRGQYKVSVKYGGEEINGSPLLLTMPPSEIAWETPSLVIGDQEWPWAIACTTNRDLYVTKNYHHTVSVLNKDGVLVKTIGIRGQKPGHLWFPTGIAVDEEEGMVYVADGLENGRIQKLSRNGQLLAAFTDLIHPCGVLLSKYTGLVYVCDRQNQRIVVLDKALKLVKVMGELSQQKEGYQEITGYLLAPHSLTEDTDGNIYVTDSDGACILVFDCNGVHTHSIHHPHSDTFGPTGVCVQGNLMYVGDCGSNQIVIFRTSGEFVTSYGQFGQMEGQFYTPLGLTMDPDGYLYVCDHCNGRIQVF